MSISIASYCQISHYCLKKDGKLLFKQDIRDASSFLKAAYRHLGISYPKYFKMDNLCKLAFLGAELVFPGSGAKERYAEDSIAIILQNSSSSLVTDKKHQESISDRGNYFPSPSVFVYTLPNIMVGEMAIRHRIKGENAVFLAPGPDAFLLFDTVSALLDGRRAECCLTGWVEEDGENLKAVLMLAEKTGEDISSAEIRESIIFEPSNIERLFKEAL